MALPKQEKRFNYRGFPCVILFMPMGYRCGYVGLPKGTKIKTDDISCHGGITYTGNSLHCQKDTDCFWIGFDCAHGFDGFDIAKVKELYADDRAVMRLVEITESERSISDSIGLSTVCTLEYCEKQCKGIIEQVIMMGIESEAVK